jgi:geranylgeranylglycerol-phosphate geranylgeranyltransferase
MGKGRIYWEFARPFTLLAPAAGMIAGGLIAWGALPRFVSTWSGAPWKVFVNIATGALMAAVMNAGSNGLNQIYDLDIDKINKPSRPLPSDRLTLAEAWRFTVLTFAIGLVLAWLVNRECLMMAGAAGLLTACYSVPPVRTKRWGVLASLTIAVPRGLLLPVAGWSTVKTIAQPEPWFLGLPLGLFVFGAFATKDFSDIAGDRAGGCRTLPVRYGIRKTALMISPFLSLPFLLWGVFAMKGYLSAPTSGIYAMAVLLPLLGAYTDFRILRRPEELSSGENHISWKLIYLMMLGAYAGLATVYLFPR